MIPGRKLATLARVCGAMVGAAILIASASNAARAFEIDEDDMPDIKLFRGLMKGLGLQRDGNGIDYRERSPLVVPPSRNLPAPVTGNIAEKNPAWPIDPEIKKRKAAKAELNKPARMVDEAAERQRPLRPNELARGTGATGSVRTSNNDKIIDYSQPMRPNELGYKGGLFSQLLNPKEEEYGTFVGEAPRTSLTEPPPGYRTPSPTQPYGVGKEKYNPTPIDRLLPTR